VEAKVDDEYEVEAKVDDEYEVEAMPRPEYTLPELSMLPASLKSASTELPH
jgi:hypothetical protein